MLFAQPSHGSIPWLAELTATLALPSITPAAAVDIRIVLSFMYISPFGLQTAFTRPAITLRLTAQLVADL